jgi:hypothetical protein
VPLIIGWTDESQGINVLLMKGFIERKVREEYNGSIE